MQQLSLNLFDELMLTLIESFPNFKSFFKSARIFYHPDGGSYRNGSLSLCIENTELCEVLTTVSSSSGITKDNADVFSISFAKILFLNLIAKNVTHKQLADYFYSNMNSLYRNVELEHRDDYSVVEYTTMEIKPKSSIFSVSLMLNSFVFVKDELNPTEVKYTKRYSGETVFYSKYSINGDFSYKNIVGMLSLNPSFLQSSELYKNVLNSTSQKVINAIGKLSPGEGMIEFELKDELVNMNLSEGNVFEEYSAKLLTYIFSDAYECFSMKQQSANKDRVRIRDFIINNTNPKNKFLEYLRNQGVSYLLFDAKNYKGQLSSSDLDTFFSYISENKYFGGFGIILSRHGLSKNALRTLHSKMLSGKVEVLVLNQDDLLRMLDVKASGSDPIVVFEEKLTEIRLSA